MVASTANRSSIVPAWLLRRQGTAEPYGIQCSGFDRKIFYGVHSPPFCLTILLGLLLLDFELFIKLIPLPWLSLWASSS